jgi:hypothetical protein
LENRLLDFDSAAATEAASLAATRQKSGRPVDARDTQIAGIALARRATLATRNVPHFGDLAISIVDPWGGSECLTREFAARLEIGKTSPTRRV